MNRPEGELSRREFLQRSIRGAGVCAAGVAGLEALERDARAAGGDTAKNPFAYDIDSVSRFDPRLLKYGEVKKFSTAGKEPRRIAVGPDDHVYVATASGVQVLDQSGNSLRQIDTETAARCMAVADDGTVYIGLRRQVEVFDRQGRHVSSWQAPTQKTWFTGMSVAANDVFAADSANRVILRYDRSGKLAGRIGEKNPQRNIPGLIVPSPYLDVKTGSDGLLRVNNPGRHRVEVFTPGGDLEFSFGKPSIGIEGFCGCCNPVGLALFPDGRCVTCEKGLPRVKVYSVERLLESVVAGPETFGNNGRPGQVSERADGTLGGLDAAIDSQGRILVLDLVSGDIRVMRAKG